MSNMLKCPNPTCPYVFDPSQVPVGVVLSCPRCGMQFTLGAPAASTAPAYTSSSGARPAAPAQPSAPAFAAESQTAVKEPAPDAPPRPRSSRVQLFILAGIAAVLMAGTALTIIFKITQRGESLSADTVSRLNDLNVSVDTPPAGWKRDDALRVTVGSPFVMSYKREGPEAYMLFGVHKPAVEGRSPRPSEMLADLMRVFPKLFDRSSLQQSDPAESKWMGETVAPGHGFNFKIQSNDGLIWRGEAYTVAYKGIAYFWVSWCGEADYEGLKDEFAKFRGKFKLLQTRNDWRETQSNLMDFKGDKVPYTITDAEELWKEVPAADVDLYRGTEPDLERRLRIYLTPKRDPKARPNEAELSVYILDGTGDPIQVARKFAEDKETARIRAANSELAPPTFKELTDPPQGDPSPTTVPAPAPVVRLVSEIKDSKDAARLIVVSAHQAGNKLVVVHCWCEASKRDTFETKFVQIASSLR